MRTYLYVIGTDHRKYTTQPICGPVDGTMVRSFEEHDFFSLKEFSGAKELYLYELGEYDDETKIITPHLEPLRVSIRYAIPEEK